MRHQQVVLWGALCAEFRMQVRRTALWLTLTFLALCSLPFVGGLGDLLNLPPHGSVLAALCRWSVLVNFLMLIGVAFFMADRLPRDQRTHVDELFATVADGLGARMVGKYLGSLSAALVPLSLWYLLGVVGLWVHTHDAAALGWGVVTYGAIILPGALFVGAFSLACPAFLGVPLYQLLFVGYWLWGNAFPPYPHFPIPTLSGTVITPVGSAISVGFFGVSQFGLYTVPPLAGVASLLLLVLMPGAVLAFLIGGLRWRLRR